MLFRQVDDAYATIVRQAFFALFERQAHEMVNAKRLGGRAGEAYVENLHNQFGDAVELSDEFRWEWVSIPHIYSVPFYVYAYSFGQLLVLSLYQQYKKEGEAFKPRYRKILATGGSDAPERVLSTMPASISATPAFWQGGFDVIDELVHQLEALPIPVTTELVACSIRVCHMQRSPVHHRTTRPRDHRAGRVHGINKVPSRFAWAQFLPPHSDRRALSTIRRSFHVFRN